MPVEPTHSYLRARLVGACALVSILACSHVSDSQSTRDSLDLDKDQRPHGCDGKRSPNHPFTVGLPQEFTSEIFSSAQRGILAVKYDCEHIEVQPSCVASGKYISHVTKSVFPEAFSFSSKASLWTELWLGAPALERLLPKDQTLTIKYVAHEERRASGPPDLFQGTCSEATHWIKSFTVGAFSAQDQSHGITAQVGDLDSCSQGGKNVSTACPTVIQVELSPIPVQGMTEAGFGAAIRELAKIPVDAPLTPFDRTGGIKGADLEFISLADKAMTTEMSPDASADDKWNAWDSVARHKGIRPDDKEKIEKRKAEWRAVADREREHKKQVELACDSYYKDLDALLELLSAQQAITPAQKNAYKEEFARTYDPWEEAIGSCVARRHEERRREQKNSITGWMVQIPANPRPPGTRSFQIDSTEVTMAAYQRCVNEKVCTRPHQGAGCNWELGRRNHPINCVDFTQAKEFCRWAHKRLPSETEWEYAAEGDEQRKYPWGMSAPGQKACWKGGDVKGIRSTCEVADYPDSDTPAGLHDMAGNVWEFTIATDGQPILRGGGWSSWKEGDLQVKKRDACSESYRGLTVGFRCAR